MAKAAKKTHWTEAEVFRKLSGPFPEPAYITLPQVRNGTGYSRTRCRTADAVIASVWPSRGLYLTGVEIKVSKSDWRRELADADKSDHIQKYCRYWYVAAPADVIPLAEVPDTWGYIEVTTRGAKIVKPAPQLEPVAIDMLLLCSILRKVSECTVLKSEVNATIQERVEHAEAGFKSEHERQLKRLRDCIDAFEQGSGVKLEEFGWRNGKIGEAVKMVLDSQHLSILESTRSLANFAHGIVRKCEKALANIGETIEVDEPGEFD